MTDHRNEGNSSRITRREFLGYSGLLGAGLLAAGNPYLRPLVKRPAGMADGYFPVANWRTSTPEEQGIESRGIRAMLEKIAADTPYVHSFLLIRHGALVAEAYLSPFSRDLPHILFSATKSVTSALLGIAIQDGFIKGIDQKVLELFPDIAKKNPHPKVEKLTIEHLLTMSTGQAFQISPTPYKPKPVDWVELFLTNPTNTIVYEPGSVFMYTSGASHTISAILQKTTGRKLSEYAAEKLFKPLGITPYGWADDQNGITFGNSWLRLLPTDMAKFGYLYLNRGNWNGKQIIPADWVDRSTRKHIETKGVQINAAEQDGYGYFFWMNGFGGYSAHGYGGQFIFVIPEMDLVAVFTGGYDDDVFDTSYKLMRDYIIPAVKDKSTLPANKQEADLVYKQIEILANQPGQPIPPLPEAAVRYSGKTFRFSDGLTLLTFSFKPGADTVHVKNSLPFNDSGELAVMEYDAGLDDRFRISEVFDPVMGTSRVAAKGRWIDETTFEETIITTDNVTQMAYTCRFDNDRLTLDASNLFSGKVASKITLTATCID